MLATLSHPCPNSSQRGTNVGEMSAAKWATVSNGLSPTPHNSSNRPEKLATLERKPFTHTAFSTEDLKDSD